MLDSTASYRLHAVLDRDKGPARALMSEYSTSWDRFLCRGAGSDGLHREPFVGKAATHRPSAVLILMLALAIPAFRETADDDMAEKKSDLAVDLPRTLGQSRFGSRGIKHNDFHPVGGFSGQSDQGGDLATETAASTTIRIDIARARGGLVHQKSAGRAGCGQGRLLDHPAARQEPVSWQ